MFKTNSDEFILALAMAQRAGAAQTAYDDLAAHTAAQNRLMSSALLASRREVADLRRELTRERGMRIVQQAQELRNRLYSQ